MKKLVIIFAGVCVLAFAAAAQHNPMRERPQRRLLVASEELLDPALQPRERGIADGQRASLDEQILEVTNGAARGQPVKRLVAALKLAARDPGKDRGGRAVSQPAKHVLCRARRVERVKQRVQPDPDTLWSIAEQLGQPDVKHAACAQPTLVKRFLRTALGAT